jgi:hypothetical protein
MLVGFLPLPAQAQKFLETYQKPMPKMEFMPQAEFDALTDYVEAKPFDIKALEYSIRLPKEWTQSETPSQTDVSASNKVFSEIARFHGPPSIDSRSSITIKTINLEFRQNAEQWMMWYLLKHGMAVQGFQGHGDARAEALYVIVENDVQYAIRSLAVLNGKQAVLVEYSLPTDNWQDEKIIQAQVIDSFRLKHEVVEDIENMVLYRFLDISGFEHPESWQLKAMPLKTVDRMRVELLSLVQLETEERRKRRILNGKMEIDLVAIHSSKPLNEEVEEIKQRVGASGLMIGELVDFKDDFKAHEALKFKAIDVYDVQDNKNDLIKYELWIGTLASDNYYFFVTLLTPSRDQDYFTWVKNSHTYLDVISRFQPVLEEEALPQ